MTATVTEISKRKATTRRPAKSQPAAEKPAASGTTATEPVVTTPQMAAKCERCGFTFKRPQKRRTCQVEAACAKRQAAAATAATAPTN